MITKLCRDLAAQLPPNFPLADAQCSSVTTHLPPTGSPGSANLQPHCRGAVDNNLPTCGLAAANMSPTCCLFAGGGLAAAKPAARLPSTYRQSASQP